MRLASLLSGGKDSVLSIQRALNGGHDVAYAVTVFPARDDSYMFHVPNLWLTSLQAESMGITHVRKASTGVKERELVDLKEALGSLDIDGVVVGAIGSRYQFTRVSKICGDLGIDVLAPLWETDPEILYREMLGLGYRVIIAGVYADGLGPEWLGRMIDADAVRELRSIRDRKGIGLSFEGGEAETLVLDCPIFSRRIAVDSAEARWQTCRGEYIVSKAHLEEKPIGKEAPG
jgi:ABC transporter with metal-binding/Fe-S-binding domain ATP-binding protein